MRRNGARGRLKVGGVAEHFQEEQGVSGQLLLNKPWPVSIRLQELIRHETGRAWVRDGGHWVTKRAETSQEGLRFNTALTQVDWKINQWRNQMISSETNLPHLRRHPLTNTQPFHPDLLASNRSTSPTTETDTLVSRALVLHSVVVFVGPLHWKGKKKHRNHQHLAIYQVTIAMTPTELPIISLPHRHLSCSLVRVETIPEEPSTRQPQIVQIPANNWNKLAVG